MATADSVKVEIQNLIAKANATTGKDDTTLTDGVNSLCEGYGQSSDADAYAGEVEVV